MCLPACLADWLASWQIFSNFSLFSLLFFCQLAIGFVVFFFGVGNIYRCFVFFLPLRRATMYRYRWDICDLSYARIAKQCPSSSDSITRGCISINRGSDECAKSDWNTFLANFYLSVCVCHFPLFFSPHIFVPFIFVLHFMHGHWRGHNS